jgi:two-component system LytT family response regulator
MKTKRAVIIDDEPFVREDLRHMLLKHPQVEVVGEAGSITEAAKLLRQTNPDIVFLDIQLRGGSGFDLVPDILPDSDIIFFSAHDEYEEQINQLNALDYLLKPVSAARLAESLSKVEKKDLSKP